VKTSQQIGKIRESQTTSYDDAEQPVEPENAEGGGGSVEGQSQQQGGDSDDDVGLHREEAEDVEQP
jgi:hypothetical protein